SVSTSTTHAARRTHGASPFGKSTANRSERSTPCRRRCSHAPHGGCSARAGRRRRPRPCSSPSRPPEVESVLNPSQAIEQVQRLRDVHMGDKYALDTVRRYWKGRQAIPHVIPSGAPDEVKRMARIARVNICPIVID